MIVQNYHLGCQCNCCTLSNNKGTPFISKKDNKGVRNYYYVSK